MGGTIFPEPQTTHATPTSSTPRYRLRRTNTYSSAITVPASPASPVVLPPTRTTSAGAGRSDSAGAQRAGGSGPQHGSASGVGHGTTNSKGHGNTNGSGHGTTSISHGNASGPGHGSANGPGHGSANGPGHGSASGPGHGSASPVRWIGRQSPPNLPPKSGAHFSRTTAQEKRNLYYLDASFRTDRKSRTSTLSRHSEDENDGMEEDANQDIIAPHSRTCNSVDLQNIDLSGLEQLTTQWSTRREEQETTTPNVPSQGDHTVFTSPGDLEHLTANRVHESTPTNELNEPKRSTIAATKSIASPIANRHSEHNTDKRAYIVANVWAQLKNKSVSPENVEAFVKQEVAKYMLPAEHTDTLHSARQSHRKPRTEAKTTKSSKSSSVRKRLVHPHRIRKGSDDLLSHASRASSSSKIFEAGDRDVSADCDPEMTALISGPGDGATTKETISSSTKEANERQLYNCSPDTERSAHGGALAPAQEMFDSTSRAIRISPHPGTIRVNPHPGTIHVSPHPGTIRTSPHPDTESSSSDHAFDELNLEDSQDLDLLDSASAGAQPTKEAKNEHRQNTFKLRTYEHTISSTLTDERIRYRLSPGPIVGNMVYSDDRVTEPQSARGDTQDRKNTDVHNIEGHRPSRSPRPQNARKTAPSKSPRKDGQPTADAIKPNGTSRGSRPRSRGRTTGAVSTKNIRPALGANAASATGAKATVRRPNPAAPPPPRKPTIRPNPTRRAADIGPGVSTGSSSAPRRPLGRLHTTSVDSTWSAYSTTSSRRRVKQTKRVQASVRPSAVSNTISRRGPHASRRTGKPKQKKRPQPILERPEDEDADTETDTLILTVDAEMHSLSPLDGRTVSLATSMVAELDESEVLSQCPSELSNDCNSSTARRVPGRRGQLDNLSSCTSNSTSVDLGHLHSRTSAFQSIPCPLVEATSDTEASAAPTNKITKLNTKQN